MLRISTALFFLTTSLLGCANTLDVKERAPSQNEGIDQGEVAKLLSKARPYFNDCYIKEKVQVAQTLMLEFDIAQSGQVSSVRIPKSEVSKSIEQCVKRELLKLRFPKHQGEPVTVTEKLKFKP